MTQISTEKSFKWHPFITFNTKNVFYLIPTKISKFSREQAKRTIIHASEQNDFSREQTNDFSRANERSGTLIEILPFKHERAVSMTNLVARLLALAQKYGRRIGLEPPNKFLYEVEQK